jgi:amino acid adenylation domain-containing protein
MNDSLLARFAAHVVGRPDHIAVRDESSELTYQQLDDAADRLAARMAGSGVGPESVVALALPRTAQTVVAILAVWKSGAAYLPVDPQLPADRIRFMLRDGAVTCLVTADGVDLDPPGDMPRIDVRSTDGARARACGVGSPDAAAYVIYTSGSTGRPKGVVVTHRGLPALVDMMVARFSVAPEDVVLQFYSTSFDASVSEIWMALGAGATLVMLPAKALTVGQSLAEAVHKHAATHVSVPPSTLAAMSASDLPPGRTVVVGGEWLPGTVVRDWTPAHRVFNVYGPTEASVIAATTFALAGSEAPDIGSSFADNRLYVLDAALQPGEPGTTGELYIAGSCLARGYFNQPALTAHRFVANPYGPPGSRMYRTGDLFRRDTDDRLFFVGRADHQVKLRGFRIELGEIEQVLASHPTIERAAVVVRGEPGDQYLVAFVAIGRIGRTEPKAIRAYLAHRLPAYMVPAAVVILEKFPVTAGGKIDRQALPHHTFDDFAEHPTPSVTADEDRLSALFAEVLRVSAVAPDDDFFDLGGHSLRAAQLAARIEAEFGVEADVDLVFDHPTVSSLAAKLREM